MPAQIEVVTLGLGPVGCAIACELERRNGCRIVGAIDKDPRKTGRDLGEVVGLDRRLGIVVRPEPEAVLAETEPDVAVVATTSSLEAIRSQLLPILAAGANVVTTCEELSYPWSTRPDLAAELDEAARGAGVSILSTGVNPGFLMDYLPSTVSRLCRDVEAVRVERFMDAGIRRGVFQTKVGAGLSPDGFAEAARNETVGHVGLRESVDMIAAALGWELSGVEVELEPVLARRPLDASAGRIDTGEVSGVKQVARGSVGGVEKIVLTFVAAVGEESPRDRLTIEGTPRIDLTVDGGVHGDLATCNVIADSIPRVVRAAPGLRTMLDVSAARAG